MISASSASLRLSWDVVAQRGRESSMYRNAALPNQPHSDLMVCFVLSFWVFKYSVFYLSILIFYTLTLYTRLGFFPLANIFFSPI